jgi:hypothetical protein
MLSFLNQMIPPAKAYIFVPRRGVDLDQNGLSASGFNLLLVVKIGDFHAKGRCAHTFVCAHPPAILPFYNFTNISLVIIKSRSKYSYKLRLLI